MSEGLLSLEKDSRNQNNNINRDLSLKYSEFMNRFHRLFLIYCEYFPLKF